MPSAAATTKVRYRVWVRWRDGTTMTVPAKYHGRVSLGAPCDRPPVQIHLGPRAEYGKVTVEIHGGEIPAVALIDTERAP